MMIEQSQKLTGIQKASVLIMSLGAQTSAEVFKQLTPAERELLGAEIVRLREVDSVTRKQVLDEVCDAMREGAIATAEQAEEPFKWLEKLDPVKIARILSTERPQGAALVLAHLSPKCAADIMMHINDNLRNEVALRLANMKNVSPEAVKAADTALRRRVEREISSYSEALGNILSNATDAVKASVLGAMAKKQAPAGFPKTPSSVESASGAKAPAAEVKSLDDLTLLTESQAQGLILRLNLEDIACVLRVASEEIKELVMRNLSRADATAIQKKLDTPGQLRLSEIDAAKERIAKAFQTGDNGEQAIAA